MIRPLFILVLLSSFCVGSLHASDLVHPVTKDLPPAKYLEQEEEVPLTTLDRLISATERSLQGQRQVRQLMIEYRQIKAQYVQNQQNRELVVRLVKMAKNLLDGIQANHLSEAFQVEFIKELSFFSQIASKKNLPKP